MQLCRSLHKCPSKIVVTLTRCGMTMWSILWSWNIINLDFSHERNSNNDHRTSLIWFSLMRGFHWIVSAFSLYKNYIMSFPKSPCTLTKIVWIQRCMAISPPTQLTCATLEDAWNIRQLALHSSDSKRQVRATFVTKTCYITLRVSVSLDRCQLWP